MRESRLRRLTFGATLGHKWAAGELDEALTSVHVLLSCTSNNKISKDNTSSRHDAAGLE